MNNLVEVRRLAGFCVILGAIVVSVCCAGHEKPSGPAAPPLLITKSNKWEVGQAMSYPFKQPLTLNGFLSGSLETNVMTVPVNDEILQIVTVTAKMTIQAPWENMMLQWNYDRPVDAQTNRYKLVR